MGEERAESIYFYFHRELIVIRRKGEADKGYNPHLRTKIVEQSFVDSH